MKSPALGTRKQVVVAVAKAFPGGRECAAAFLGMENFKRFENQIYEAAGVKPLTDGEVCALETQTKTSRLPEYICAMYGGVNGVMGQASAEAGPVLELIAGQIGETELGKELLDRIELIDGDGSGSVNDRLNEAKKELEDLIGEITDALEYDNAKAYALGEVVRLGNRLFQAIAATAGHSPPDATYWIDMGTLAETTNALVLQVQKNSASIIEQDDKITAQAEQLNAINAKVRTPWADDHEWRPSHDHWQQ